MDHRDLPTVLIDADGSVRAATVLALVERLTTHETGDPRFVKTFFLTYKSFTTLDELFNLLVQRFDIRPPDNLTSIELEEWKKLNQHVIQSRVLDTFETILTDDDVFEIDDMYILDRVKEFLQQEAVNSFPTSKRLLAWINRPGGERNLRAPLGTISPPESIVPVTQRELSLLDIHPLELARQLTMMESMWYQQIRPAECLARSRDGSVHHSDNIARIIQVTNRIVNWVTDTVLSRNDPRAQAGFLRQFILIADSCRSLQNYSTMVAILCGINSPPIHQLKRSWEQIGSQHLAQLNACEATIDSANNFTQYRSTLATIAPPCVPFIGVFLVALASIRDGSQDTLPGNLVNFRKRQDVSQVIQDIQCWQTLPHHFHLLPAVQSYVEKSLGKVTDQAEINVVFPSRSLELEPLGPDTSEDGRRARALQQSGIL